MKPMLPTSPRSAVLAIWLPFLLGAAVFPLVARSPSILLALGLAALLCQARTCMRGHGGLRPHGAGDDEIQAAFEAATVAVGILDENLCFRRANAPMVGLMSLAPGDDGGGRRLDEAMPRLASTLAPALRRVLQRGRPERDMELAEPGAGENGGLRHWLATLFPIRVKDGAAAVGMVLMDVSRQKKLEALLAFQSRILQEEALGVMLVRAADGQILHVNPAFAGMFGYAAEDMCGQPVAMLNAPGDRAADEVAAEISLVMNTQGTWQGQVENVRRDGSRFWTEAKAATFLHPEHGEVWVSNQWDITEQRAQEQALRKYADEVDDLYQNTPCGHHSSDDAGFIVRINDTELEWLGYRREEVVGKLHRSQVFAPDCREACEKAFEAFKRTGSIANLEMEMQRKDGTRFPVLLSATAIYDEDGRFLRSRAVSLDISGQKRLELEREHQRRRVEELSRYLVTVQEEERRRLSSDLHDRISANLAAVALNLGMLQDRVTTVDPAHADLLADVRGMLQDTTTAVRDICADLSPALLDFVGLQAAVEAYTTQYTARTGIRVESRVSWSGGGGAPALETQVFRIIQEALANIARHARAGRVSLLLQRTADGTDIAVADDGHGFDPRQVGRDGDCDGMGLQGMRQRAAFFGGSFSLVSRPGWGTEVRVRIPSPAAAFKACEVERCKG